MHNRIIKSQLIISLLIVTFGCSEDENGIVHRKLSGTYDLISVARSGLVTEPNSTYGMYEDITNDCDTYNVIEIKSNGTLELIEFSGDNCTNQTIKNGTWKVTSTFYGTFLGEVKFIDSNIIYDLFESGHNGDEITNFRIEYDDENPPENIENLRYHYTYIRAD